MSAIALTTAAVLHEGVPSADVELNDGSVWVTKTSALMVGRFNNQSRVLDAGVRAAAADYDIVQAGRTILVVDSANSTLSPIDPATVAMSAAVPLPNGALVELGGTTVAILDPADGALWASDAASTETFVYTAVDPIVTLGPGADLTVGLDGTIHAVSPERGEVVSIRLTGDGVQQSAQVVDQLTKESDPQIAAVGDSPVVLDAAAGTVWSASTGLREIPQAKGAVLQDSSGAASAVALTSDSDLVTVPLDGSDPVVTPAGGAGGAVAPVSVLGCVYAAWSGTGQFIRDCAGDGDDVHDEIAGLASATPRFRVNRDVVVLNDIAGGTAWMASESLEKIDNWEDIVPLEESDETEADEVTEETSLPERTEANRRPVAEDDELGVRPGRTTILPVLDNDSDPDGDVLTATVQGQPSVGTITQIYGGRGLQIVVPEGASGSDTVVYEAADGRGGVDEASLSVEVHGWEQNAGPTQRKIPVLTVEEGGSVEYAALQDWIDPDGDDLYLRSAAASGDDEVDFTPDGALTFRATGTTKGQRELAIVVSDGQDESAGTIQIDVRPSGSTMPIATPDHVVVREGEKVTVSPIANDLSPSGAPLRLARVAEVAGATIDTDFEAATFGFVAARAGTYYVQYLVAGENAEVPGLVRIDVLPPADPGDPPVAVRDVALLPSGGDVRVDVLANDVDPAGGILVVQSVRAPADARIAVSVIEHRLLQITDIGGQVGPTTVRYRVSNGLQSVEGEVVVIPVGPPASGRPPVAADDTAVVRVDDVVTIPVLDNDYSPAGSALTVAPELAEAPEDGDAFVSEGTLRYRAPSTPGTQYVTYEAVDESGQRDAGYVTITVLAVDPGSNAAPRPRDLVARTIAGTTLRIAVPLNGIDADGDSVQLVGLGSAPAKGRVEVGADSLSYEAFEDAVGLDTFTYIVRDRLGQTGTASVRVGIAGPEATNQAPFAAKDFVSVRPDRSIAVPVLVNDSDPDGDPIHLVTDGITSPTGIEAETIEDRVLVRTGGATGAFTVEYTVEDDRGARVVAPLVVVVSADLEPIAPIARDDVIRPVDVGDDDAVDVDVLRNDEDPDGVGRDLSIEVTAGDARVVGGQLRVDLTDISQIITYEVTDVDGLTASAFVMVPGFGDLGPILRSTAPLEVGSGEELVIRLDDQLLVPGGGKAIITQVDRVRAPHSNGEALVRDESTIVYTSAPGYFGADAVTFQVTDGASVEDPNGRIATLTIPIEVLPSGDQAPRLIGATVRVAPDEEPATLDLRSLASDPNPGDLERLSFAVVGDAPEGITARVNGSVLSVSADADAEAGSTLAVTVSATDGTTDPVKATITVEVLASTRPLAVVTDDAVEGRAGQTSRVDVLANDQNPFPDTPLTIASVASESSEATARVDGDAVEVTPSQTAVGVITVVYRVQDATGDPSRAVEGRIRMTVAGVPAPPGAPTVASVQDRTVVLSWTPPADNGAPITGYTVRSTSGEVAQECPATTCTITGLTNNREYYFAVTATNRIGESKASPTSALARPDARPDTPQAPAVARGDGSLSITWITPPTPGSAVESFELQISPGPLSGPSQRSGVTGTSFVWEGLENGTAYQVRIAARNGAPEPSSWSPWSATTIPAGPPDAPAAPTTARLDPVGSQSQIQVSWGAPDANGDPISGYVVRVKRGGSVVSTANAAAGATTQTFALDVSQTDYTFTVEAVNTMGSSGQSPDSAPRRAFTTPGAPTGVSASPGDNVVTVTANVGSTNGLSASELSYEYNAGGGWGAWSPSVNSGSLSGQISLPNTSGPYTISLRAVANFDGASYAGDASAPSGSVQPFGRPFAPGLWAEVIDATHYRVNWSPPSANGLPITRLRLDVGGTVSEPPVAGGSQVFQSSQSGVTVSIVLEAYDSNGQASNASTTVTLVAGAVVGVSRSAPLAAPQCAPVAAPCSGFTFTLNDGLNATRRVEVWLSDGSYRNADVEFVNGVGSTSLIWASDTANEDITVRIQGYPDAPFHIW